MKAPISQVRAIDKPRNLAAANDNAPMSAPSIKSKFKFTIVGLYCLGLLPVGLAQALIDVAYAREA